MEHDENGLEVKKDEGFSWDSPGVFGPLIAFAIVALIFAGPVAYFNRYEWGLVEPKFKPGQCVVQTYVGDFENKSFSYRINKVSKTHYQLNLYFKYGEDGVVSVTNPTTDRIEYFDPLSKEVNCPDWSEYRAL